jgi:hypothetical protein
VPGSRSLRPASLVVWTIAASASAAAVTDVRSLAMLAGAMAAYASSRAAHLRILRRATVWSLLLAVPLLVVHGIVNPRFPVSLHLHWLPIRSTGIDFALLMSVRLFILSTIAAWWYEADPMQVIHAAIRWRLPTGLVVMAAMGFASFRAATRRIDTVLQAQQARGVPIHGGLLARARSLVAVVMPVIVGSLMESDARATVLRTRGLGSGALVVPSAAAMSAIDSIDVLCGVVLCGVAMILRFA